MPPVPLGGNRRSLPNTPPDRPPMNVSFQYGGATRYAQFGTPEERRQYGWGDPGRLSGGQDLVREFQQQFQPNLGIFSPSFPLVPVEPELARLFDYPVGWNFIYHPRSYEPVSFEELRALAYNENLTRMAVETRKDQIERLDWEIRPIEDADLLPAVQGRIKLATKFWNHPDGDRPFGSWLRELLEDMLVIDAPTLEVLRNRDGSLRGLDIIDGATIKPLIDITGRRPTAPAPAFEQVIHGRPWRLFTNDELIYTPRNKRPGHLYGFSAVEQILLYINIALRRQQSQLYYFTDGSVPAGFLNIPELNPEQVARLQQFMDDLLAGNLAERRKFQLVPYGAKWQGIKEPPLKDDFDEWLARVVMFAFSLPPDAFIRQRNRSTSETARQTAQEEGLGPLLLWVKRLVDHVLQRRMGHQDLEFNWQELNETDPQVQATILTEYVKFGINSPNEARDTLGLEPVEGGDDPMLVLATGPVLLKHADDASDNTANPPVPMFGPSQMGQGGPGAGRAGGQPSAPARTAGANQRPGAAQTPAGRGNGADRGQVAGNRNNPSQARVNGQGTAKASTGTEPGVDDAGRAALEREARQLLRRQRASRVEADLRKFAA